MSHNISWVDDENCGIGWCGTTRLDKNEQFSINIYDWIECPICKKKLKLRQYNEVLEQDGGI